MQDHANIAFGIIITLLFVSLLILFCALLIKLYIHKIKNYTRVIYEKDLEYQKTLTTTILETQEQVLNEISQELHDDAGQQLTYINFLVENLKLDAPQFTETLHPVSDAVGALSNSIRRISHSLNSQLLVQQNLVKAIEAEVNRLQQPGTINFAFNTDTDEIKSLDASKQIVIYRIFQEITNNILKHAAATEINVNVETLPVFSLTVSDNGKGFDYNAVKTSGRGMGLLNLENRSALVGLTCSIQSVLGEGTTIRLSEKI